MRNIVSVDFYHVNCTDTDFIECHVAFWIWHTVPLILFCIGIFGNILNCIVLSRPRLRRNSSAVYLLFLAGSDIVFLLFGLLPDIIHAITGYIFQDNSAFFCKLRYWFIYTFGAFSVWLLVLLTVERFLLTKVPIKTKTKLTPWTSFVISLTTLLILLLANIHNITGFKLYSSKHEIIKELGSEVFFQCTYSSKGYKEFHDGILSIIILVVFNILPVIIIVVGNINIALVILYRKRKHNIVHPSTQAFELQNMDGRQEHVRPQAVRGTSVCTISRGHNEQDINDVTTHASHIEQVTPLNMNESQFTVQLENSRHNSQAGTNHGNTIRKSKYNSPTRMLFTLTIFFIITTTPYCVFVVFKSQLHVLSDREVAVWQLIYVSVLVFGWCNYAFNFFLYFVSGTLFKREWTRLILIGKAKFRQLFR